jgi:hypothetical protein
MADASFAAPAADAPAPAPAEAAPAAPAEAPKPPDPLAELDERIQKAGLKVKVGGKEKPVQSMREALRALERVGGVEARLAEVAEKERQAAAVIEREARLKQARNGRERVAILREMAGEAFDEAAEEAILERIEREKQMEGMSPRERQMAQALAEREARLAQYEEAQRAAQERAQKEEEDAEFQQLRERIASVALKTLQAANIPKSAAADAGRRLAFLMSRSQALGLDLSEEELAPKVLEHARGDARSYMTGMQDSQLLEWVGDDVARKISRAWLAKAEGRPKATLPTPAAPSPAARSDDDIRSLSPMAAWNRIAKGLK